MALGKMFGKFKDYVNYIQNRNQDYGSGYSDETGTYGNEGDLMEGNPEYYPDADDMYPVVPELFPDRAWSYGLNPAWGDEDPVLMGGDAQFEEQPRPQPSHIGLIPREYVDPIENLTRFPLHNREDDII